MLIPASQQTTTRRPRRRKRLPRLATTRALEARYAADSKRLMREYHDRLTAAILPLYEGALAEWRATHDSAQGDLWRGMGAAHEAAFGAVFRAAVIQELTSRTFAVVTAFNREANAAVFAAAIGFNPMQSEAWLEPKREQWLFDNVQRIKLLPERHFDEIRLAVKEGIDRGARVEELRAKFTALYQGEGTDPGKAIANAERLARDQVLTLHADMTRARHEELGIEEYIWRTMGDARVRDRHEDREGVRFRYDQPPKGGHPGTEVQCRCFAEPVIPGVNDA